MAMAQHVDPVVAAPVDQRGGHTSDPDRGEHCTQDETADPILGSTRLELPPGDQSQHRQPEEEEHTANGHQRIAALNRVRNRLRVGGMCRPVLLHRH